MIEPGIKNTLVRKVTDKDTALALGSGLLNVFSTPMLIAFMEEASHTMVAPYLDEGASTVGISMNMKHLAATPVGMEVKINAVLKEVDRKRLVFEVEAYDEAGLIGTAVHERFIVDSEKFMQKVNSK